MVNMKFNRSFSTLFYIKYICIYVIKYNKQNIKFIKGNLNNKFEIINKESVNLIGINIIFNNYIYVDYIKLIILREHKRKIICEKRILKKQANKKQNFNNTIKGKKRYKKTIKLYLNNNIW